MVPSVPSLSSVLIWCHFSTGCLPQAKHTSSLFSFGVNGDTGKIVDMKEYGLWESASVKVQILKTAVEVSFWSLISKLNSFISFNLVVSSYFLI